MGEGREEILDRRVGIARDSNSDLLAQFAGCEADGGVGCGEVSARYSNVILQLAVDGILARMTQQIAAFGAESGEGELNTRYAKAEALYDYFAA